MSTKRIAKLGVLAALSVVLVALVHFPLVPAASFLEYDPADVPIMLGTFAMGPEAGLLLTVVAATIQGLTVSAAGSWYGILMHIIATGTYVTIAGICYKRHKTKKGAVISMVIGICAWVIVMIPANLILTPLYMQVDVSMVKALLPAITLFNLLKSVINSVLTFFLYKKVVRFLK